MSTLSDLTNPCHSDDEKLQLLSYVVLFCFVLSDYSFDFVVVVLGLSSLCVGTLLISSDYISLSYDFLQNLNIVRDVRDVSTRSAHHRILFWSTSWLILAKDEGHGFFLHLLTSYFVLHYYSVCNSGILTFSWFSSSHDVRVGVNSWYWMRDMIWWDSSSRPNEWYDRFFRLTIFDYTK